MDLVFVLMEPRRAENVGATARALKTMGFSTMRLVRPRVTSPDRARAVAHGSGEVLDSSVEFESLPSAVADCDLVVATTARRRGNRKEYHSSRELCGFLEHRKSNVTRAAIVFGNEESGLSNDDMSLAQVVTSIDLRSSHPSLNLAQAVMVYAYELSPLALNIHRRKPGQPSQESIRALHGKVGSILTYLNVANEALGHRILERVPLAGVDDVRLMHSLANRLLHRFGAPSPSLPPTTDQVRDTNAQQSGDRGTDG